VAWRQHTCSSQQSLQAGNATVDDIGPLHRGLSRPFIEQAEEVIANSEPNREVLPAEEVLTRIAGGYFSADQSRTSVFVTLPCGHTLRTRVVFAANETEVYYYNRRRRLHRFRELCEALIANVVAIGAFVQLSFIC
jgi:hypothetical protein